MQTCTLHLDGILAVVQRIHVDDRAREPQAQQASAHGCDAFVEHAKDAEALFLAANTHGLARVLLFLMCQARIVR